jgi:hypothetical protein
MRTHSVGKDDLTRGGCGRVLGVPLQREISSGETARCFATSTCTIRTGTSCRLRGR